MSILLIFIIINLLFYKLNLIINILGINILLEYNFGGLDEMER